MSPPLASDPPHQHAAAAMAELSRGRELLEDGRAEEALRAAQAGIDALGRDYAPRGTRDSTTLKIYAARELARAGRLEDAAATTLRMLAERLALYQQKHGVALGGG